MSAGLQTLLALGSISVLLGLMMAVRRLAQGVGLTAEVQRKAVHIGTGLYALTLPWLFPDRWPVYMLIAVTLGVMLVLRLPNVAKRGLGATLHGVARKSYGDILLALSIGICFFLSAGDTVLFVLPIAVLTLADAAAALVGSAYGKRLFQVEESQKSVEGSVVFFMVTLLIALIVLMLFSPYPPVNILMLSLMIAAFGTLVEADSWRGFDNLFLPLGLLVFLSTHGQSSIIELLLLAALFLLSLAGMKLLARPLGLRRHSARVYVVTVFMLLAVTAFQNALLPVMVLVAHAWARSRNPCAGKYSDLDVVAALALLSFGWLTLGNASGWNAVSFYGLHAMGLTMGLSALAVVPLRPLRRGAVLLVIVALLFAMRLLVVAANPVLSNWAEPLNPVALAVLGLMLLPSLRPAFFHQMRVLKLTLLSAGIPLAVYLLSIDLSKGMP